jgi:hypothetical protein
MVTSAASAVGGDAAHAIPNRAIANCEATQKFFDADIMLTKP